ncbi:unnamed protein product [marine sediment metagenome]|uniref:Uncharacterized protein n=1 Tax=marine sediment metagenome TaxID=412755 RepID=X0UYH8_9ZZZZ
MKYKPTIQTNMTNNSSVFATELYFNVMSQYVSEGTPPVTIQKILTAIEDSMEEYAANVSKLHQKTIVDILSKTNKKSLEKAKTMSNQNAVLMKEAVRYKKMIYEQNKKINDLEYAVSELKKMSMLTA